MGKNKILAVDNISVSYGVVRALRGVSIEVSEGEIVSLIGANNAGKSTLLETILGINRVDSGKIEFMGSDIANGATDKIVATLGRRTFSDITLHPDRFEQEIFTEVDNNSKGD